MVGEGLKEDNDVMTWEECSALCTARVECTVWKWHHENAGHYSYICNTMATYTSTTVDQNVISGTRACKGKIKGKAIRVKFGKSPTNPRHSLIQITLKCSWVGYKYDFTPTSLPIKELYPSLGEILRLKLATDCSLCLIQ